MKQKRNGLLLSVAALAVGVSAVLFEVELSAEFLLVIFAGLTAVLFEYFPGLAAWYEGLLEHQKKQVMAVVLFVEAALAFAGICASIVVSEGLICDVKSAVDMFYMWLIAIGVNQGVHRITKKSAG